MITITERPGKEVSGITYRWVSVYNPVVYTFNTSGNSNSSFVEVEVYESGTDVLLSSSRYKPLKDGELKVDISNILKAYLENDYNYPLTGAINNKDNKTSICFYIKYSHKNSLIGNDNFISDEANIRFATVSAAQVGQSRTLSPYVPTGGQDKAKFLTAYKEPVLFQSNTFTLSFIYSEELSGVEIKLVEEYLDINKNLIGTHETQLDTSQINKVNYLKLTGPYPANVKYVKAYLKTGAAIPEIYVNTGYVTTGYTD